MKLYLSLATVLTTFALAAPAQAAWTADVSGPHAYLTSDGSPDIVQVWAEGAVLRHSASGPGFASGTDFNSTAGVVETVPNNGATQLHIDGGGENDFISIGITGSPWTSIHTLFEIQGGAGEDLATLGGPDNTAALTANLTANGITAGVGSIDYYGLEALVPELGAGADTVNVLSTNLHTVVEVDGSGGGDTANVGSIANLKGGFTLDGEGGSDRLVYTDPQGSGYPYLISGGTITRDGGAPVRASADTESVSVTTGSGADTIYKTGSRPVAINSGAGDDFISTRDSFADAPVCGAGTDYVAVDSLDTLLPECETSDRPKPVAQNTGGTGSTGTDQPSQPQQPTQPQQPQVPAADKTAPKTSVGGLPKSLKLKALLKGIKPAIATDEAAAVEVQLLGSTSTTKLSRTYNVTLAQGKLGLGTGARALKLKPAKKLLGKAKKFSVQVKVVATDAAGNRTTAVKTLKVAR